MSITPGARIGPYEILSQLGRGAMGVVYRARDIRLRRDVAIKILPDHLADDPDRLVRFQREAQALAALNHPNIAQIYGLEEGLTGQAGPAGQAHSIALVMELVEGETLADLVRRGPVPLADALQITRQLAAALAAAHERGIVHRDLKPANVKLNPDGQVKVLDFGLAKILGGRPGEIGTMSSTMQEGTIPGVVMGTAPYMSPEQARGKDVDARTDIWAFGCVLYELLTGHPAFEGETITDVLAKIVTGHPDWTRLPHGTPATVRTLLALTLEREVKQRLQHVGDARPFLDEERFTHTRERRTLPRWRPWLVTGTLGIALAVALVFVVLYLRSPSHEDTGSTGQQSATSAAATGAAGGGPSAGAVETPKLPVAPPPVVPTTAVAVPAASDPALARDAWERVKGSGNRAALEAFLRAYGTTEFASPARVELALLAPAEKLAASSTDPRAGQERTNLKDTQRYVWIPPGTFTMGCSPGDIQCLDDERPPHKVEISHSFWLGQTPVTVGPWQRYRTQTGVAPLPGTDLLGRKINGSAGDATVPVVTIKWDMARAFCEWAGGRLPTEAEWEYAGRAGATGSRYGDVDKISWYAENSGRQQIDTAAMQTLSRDAYEKILFENGNGPHPVGQKQANAWNLYDMLGNVQQWTADTYSPTFYRQSASRDPAGATEGDSFVTRGGSWFTTARQIRFSSRAPIPKFEVRSGVGFRCVLPS